MMGNLTTVVVSLFLAWALHAIYRRLTRISISHLQCPEPDSFWLGNLAQFRARGLGVADFEWQEKYGMAFRFKGTIGEDRLWLSDPKALQYILHKEDLDFPKPASARAVLGLVLDHGLAWAEGDVHKRQKKIMLPAFGMREARGFCPMFQSVVGNLVSKWNDILSTEESGRATIDVHSWLNKATLDAIGKAAFEYDFGALDDDDNPLTKSYHNLGFDLFSDPKPAQIFSEGFVTFFPSWFLMAMYEHFPAAALQKLRDNRADVHSVSRQLLEAKTRELSIGQGRNDVLSLLLKANVSESESTRLETSEIIPQMRTILLAGHETAASSMTWALYEISMNQKAQERMRAEIRETEAAVRARGDVGIQATDFDSMLYTIAVIKETLRLHPPAFQYAREAGKDDVIPLSKPILSKTGKLVNEIPIPKGMHIIASAQSYNRLKDIWGEDAHEFNPDRWLSSKEMSTPPIGMYGNLLTFSSGTRNCIGWRFAVVQLHTFLINLVSNFEFAPTEKSRKVKRERTMVIVPVVQDEREKGAQLPLWVTPISKD